MNEDQGKTYLIVHINVTFLRLQERKFLSEIFAQELRTIHLLVPTSCQRDGLKNLLYKAIGGGESDVGIEL